MKLLGDASLLPPGMILSDKGITTSGGHSKHPSAEEMSFGVLQAKLPNKS